jgi:adenosylmethionine-8-amino-7-oxononanoate aminotransferase
MIAPPFVVTEDQIQEITQILHHTLSELRL